MWTVQIEEMGSVPKNQKHCDFQPQRTLMHTERCWNICCNRMALTDCSTFLYNLSTRDEVSPGSVLRFDVFEQTSNPWRWPSRLTSQGRQTYNYYYTCFYKRSSSASSTVCDIHIGIRWPPIRRLHYITVLVQPQAQHSCYMARRH